MKKALVYDWYTVYGGAERCFNTIWPDLEHYALIDFLNSAQRKSILKGKAVNTSFIQKLPFAKKHYRKYLPLFPCAIEQFDLNDYELVLSCSSCVSKGVLTNHNQCCQYKLACLLTRNNHQLKQQFYFSIEH